MFGNKTRPIADFLPRVLAHIDGIDTDMVATYTMDSVIQFLRDTKLMTEIICLSLEECKDSYRLNTVNRITEVLAVRFIINGRQQFIPPLNYRITDDVLYLQGSLQGLYQASVEVEVAVAPKRDSEDVPEFIYEEWVDAITALTLSKLYLLTDNEWYNPQAANNQNNLYQQSVRQALFGRVTKHKPLNMRLRSQRRL